MSPSSIIFARDGRGEGGVGGWDELGLLVPGMDGRESR